jgi:hypothetical protein
MMKQMAGMGGIPGMPGMGLGRKAKRVQQGGKKKGPGRAGGGPAAKNPLGLPEPPPDPLGLYRNS